MYDGTDVAFVLGGLFSAGVGGASLIAALVALGFFVSHKGKKEKTESRAGRWAAFFVVTAVLCGISIPCGMAVYDLFEHQRGSANPPSHVLAVAASLVWGPIVAILFGAVWLGRRD